MPTKLELTLDKLAVSVDKQSKQAYQRLLGLINAGTKPQEALQAIYLNFSKGSFNQGYLEALAAAFTVLLEKPFTASQMLHYPVGAVTLSTKLYSNATEVSKNVTKVLEDHAQVIQDLRKLSLDIFSGYNQKSVEVLKAGDVLPAYLKDAYSPYATEIDKVLARTTAEGLATPALRAAYSTALDKLESGAAKKALSKAMEVAAYEKQRYLANRIAQTETARAYAKKAATDLKQRDNVQYVQLRPAGSHKADLCDVYLYADPCGMGEGTYRKDDAPVPPFHPHCKCRLIGLVNKQTPTDAPDRPNAQADYFNNLSEEEQKQVLPTQAMRDQLKNGESLTNILNQRNGKDYQIMNIGDY